jgi:hypothetical protein
MSIEPQQMLVEERGLENQIKRLKDLVPTKDDADRDDFIYTAKYLQERLTEVIEDLETIKDCIKSENDRILKDAFKKSAKGSDFEIKS